MDTALTSAYKGAVSLVNHKGKEPARCLDIGTGVSSVIQLSPSSMPATPGPFFHFLNSLARSHRVARRCQTELGPTCLRFAARSCFSKGDH